MSHDVRHLKPIYWSHDCIVAPATRNLELRNLCNFMLPWRLQIGGMCRTDLREAAKLLRLTATMCDEYANARPL